MRRQRFPWPLYPRLMDDQISKEKTVSNSGGESHTQVLEMDYTKAKFLSYFKKITYTMRYIDNIASRHKLTFLGGYPA